MLFVKGKNNILVKQNKAIAIYNSFSKQHLVDELDIEQISLDESTFMTYCRFVQMIS